MTKSAMTATDCRTDDGITVGIIDALITLVRLFRSRAITSDVIEALKDIGTDEDFHYLLEVIDEASEQ